MREPEWFLTPDQLHIAAYQLYIQVTRRCLVCVPEKCNLLTIRRKGRIGYQAWNRCKRNVAHTGGFSACDRWRVGKSPSNNTSHQESTTHEDYEHSHAEPDT